MLKNNVNSLSIVASVGIFKLCFLELWNAVYPTLEYMQSGLVESTDGTPALMEYFLQFA